MGCCTARAGAHKPQRGRGLSSEYKAEKEFVKGEEGLMKRTLVLSVLLMVLLAACGAGGEPVEQATALLVTDGVTEKSYSLADLEALPAAEASFNGVTYKGVVLSVLLEDAGFSPQDLSGIDAIASDGYRVPFKADLFLLPDTLVAYAQSDGPLADDDGAFRMVLPEQEGKINVRMLAELRLKP